jgi:hypothetical protein
VDLIEEDDVSILKKRIAAEKLYHPRQLAVAPETLM